MTIPPRPHIDLWEYRRYMKSRHYADNTVRRRFADAARFLRRHPDLDAVSHRDVEEWIRSRALSPASSRALLVNLRALYRWALREEVVTRDPTALVDRPRVPARLPRPAPDREIARLVEVADVQLRALLALMACAGLRCVECSRLDWSDVDLVEGTVVVMGKGMRERLITLSPDVVRAVAALRLASDITRLDSPVFVGPSSRRLQAHRVSQLVNRSFRELGYTTTAHSLRHRCATAALALPGVDLLQVRDLLGHSSVATTQIYTATMPGRTAATSKRLNLPGARPDRPPHPAPRPEGIDALRRATGAR